LPGEVSKGIKGPLKLLLRQPEDGEEQTAAEQQQQKQQQQQQQQQQDEDPTSPGADSAAATAAGDGVGDSLIDIDSVGELAAGLQGGASGRGSSCSGVVGEVEEDEEGGVRRLADSSASIRRYHMLRRAETGEQCCCCILSFCCFCVCLMRSTLVGCLMFVFAASLQVFCCYFYGVVGFVPPSVMHMKGLLPAAALLAGTSEVEYSEAPSPEPLEEADAEQQQQQQQQQQGQRGSSTAARQQ
jgi:hypothetical protein